MVNPEQGSPVHLVPNPFYPVPTDDELDAEAEEEAARIRARNLLFVRLPGLRARCSLAYDLTAPIAVRLEAAEEAMEMFMDLVLELEQRNRKLLIETYVTATGTTATGTPSAARITGWRS